MSWWHNRYRERPASRNKSARIAWDCLAKDAAEMNPPRAINMLHYAPEMEAWIAMLNRIEGDPEHYIEIDALCMTDHRNNPHKYEPAAGVRGTYKDVTEGGQ
jgi:hypothetical protein